jgi:hypothetical protein
MLNKRHDFVADNIILAKFLGYEIEGALVTKSPPRDVLDEYEGYSVSMLNFHTSWDALMRVTEKVNSLSDEDNSVSVIIKPKSTSIEELNKYTWVIRAQYRYLGMLHNTHQALVHFVKRYNKNNNK